MKKEKYIRLISSNGYKDFIIGKILLLLLLPFSFVQANTLNVCSDSSYTSIQSAVNAASSGDTISICPDTYTEHITINTDNLTIESSTGNQNDVIINSSSQGITATSINTLTVQNLTITASTEGISITGLSAFTANNVKISAGRKGSIYGINLHDGNYSIQNSDITATRDAIYLFATNSSGNATINVTGSTIEAGRNGDGVYVDQFSTITADNVNITAGQKGIRGEHLYDGNNSIKNANISAGDNGIYLDATNGNAALDITGSTISSDTSKRNDGVRIKHFNTVIADNSNITAGYMGIRGESLSDGTYSIQNAIISSVYNGIFLDAANSTGNAALNITGSTINTSNTGVNGDGVHITKFSNTTADNVYISAGHIGIYGDYLYDGNYSVKASNITSVDDGVSLVGTNAGTLDVASSSFKSTNKSGIHVTKFSTLNIADSSVSAYYRGIYAESLSDGNRIIKDSNISAVNYGVYLNGSGDSNSILGSCIYSGDGSNNFVNNISQSINYNDANNSGNYWSTLDGTGGFSNTCTDSNGDGVCDASLEPGNAGKGTDYYPVKSCGLQQDVFGGGGSVSEPIISGPFNLIETNTQLNGQDPVDTTDSKNYIYTKVMNRNFSISLVHLSDDNITVKDTFNGFVSIDTVDVTNNVFLQKNIWYHSFVSNIANASLPGQYEINNLNLMTIGKDVKFRINYIDWDQLLANNPGVVCANHSTIHGNLSGVPSCLDDKSKLKAIFPIVGESCLDAITTGAPCESNRHGIGIYPYNNDYGCALCLLGGGAHSYSRDDFAIRPDKFVLSNLPTMPRAGKDYNITVTAVAYSKTTAETAYTANKSELSIGQTIYYPDGTTSPTLNGTLAFSTSDFTIANGTASDVGVTFDDVGKVDINISDANWTLIDENDTTADCSATGRLICGDANVTFIPEHFTFTTNSLGNYQGLGFTYISSDLNISAPLNLVVVAESKNETPTKNFNSTAWENPVNITFSLVNIPTGYILSNVERKELTGDNNLTFDVNGSKILLNTDANVSVNFERNVSVAKNPFVLLGSDVNVTATSNYTGGISITGSSLADTNATFIYGRTHAPRKRFVGATGVDYIYYEAYCNGSGCNKALLPNGSASTSSDDPRWFVNTNHITASGNAGSVLQKGANNIQGTTSTGTPATSTLTYSGSTYPYKATMENNASSWLIYNKYNAGATKNEFEVEFVKSGDWAGQHETNATTDPNASANTNRRTMW